MEISKIPGVPGYFAVKTDTLNIESSSAYKQTKDKGNNIYEELIPVFLKFGVG